MAENKMKETAADVDDFIETFAATDQKKKDSYRLISLLEKATGFPAKMWGPSIIGFGSYHYQYESGHQGDAPLAAFSPRKAAISLYVYMGQKEAQPLLEKLGKYKMGKACIYVNKLSDIDEAVFLQLVSSTLKAVAQKYPSK